MSSARALRPATASAAGKLILLGEHVVVHGHPGLVAAIDRGVRVTFTPGSVDVAPPDGPVGAVLALAGRLLGIAEPRGTIEIAGDLPIGMGLGSSAALAVAVLRALVASAGLAIGDATVAAHAHEIERLFHGTPSGVDSTAATYGGVLWFVAGPPPRHESLTLRRALPLVVALSRTPHATAQTVSGLRERAAAAPEVYQPVFAAIAALVAAARDALLADDRNRLGALLSMNHELLRACGVSTAELDALVAAARDAGALGAKLTGAGGGGAVLALPAGDADELCGALAAQGHDAFVTTVGGAPRADRHR
jgi:mevalonate kinase